MTRKPVGIPAAPPGEPFGSVQPGGGLLFALACGARLARRWLWRRLRPRYVARMAALRQGHCPGCAHDVIDDRDLLAVRNVCGHRWPAAASVSPWRDRLGLVRLGRPELGAAALLSVLLLAAAAAVHWTLLPLAASPLLFALWFFRDPARAVPAAADLVLAPADGVVDDLRLEAGCPWFEGPALRIGIYLSLFDVHVQRAPFAGAAAAVSYHRGAHVRTAAAGATDGNEQCATTFAGAGRCAVVRQLAGPVARRIVNLLRRGEAVAAGQRFGLIKFGSRVELWLPAAPGLRLRLGCGQRLRAGESILASWASLPVRAAVPSPVVPIPCREGVP